MNIIKLSNNSSPKGLGYNAKTLKLNTTMIGKNGKIYIVKNNKWIISDFYKEYKKIRKKINNIIR